jgi:hypothetical protein
MFHPNGQPSGDDVVVNTTLAGDQTTPSIASLPGGEQPDGPFLLGWTDDSAAQPDDQPGAIRARVIYPDLARRDGVVGAHCGAVGDAPCATGLACANAPQGGALCLTECTEPEGTACAAGGTCTGGVCVFPAR